MMWNKPAMVTAETALPGRDAPIRPDATHVVLGTSIVPPFPDDTETIYLAMGCYWGAERIYWKLPGVHTTAVGFMGGYTKNPTYREVTTSQTGHTETCLVVYRPAEVSVETLMKAFWENHDPTTPNRQGNDIGTQYRSAVFTTTPAQLRTVIDTRNRYQQALTEAGYGEIATQIEAAHDAGDGQFYYAETEHQGYLHKHPNGYCNHGYCQVGYNLDAHGQSAASTAFPS